MTAASGAKARSRRATDRAKHLVTTFHIASDALWLQRFPGWEVASADLLDALNDCRDIGDISSLPVPASWWGACLVTMRCWLNADTDDHRRGMELGAHAMAKSLQEALERGTLAQPEAAHGVGVR